MIESVIGVQFLRRPDQPHVLRTSFMLGGNDSSYEFLVFISSFLISSTHKSFGLWAYVVPFHYLLIGDELLLIGDALLAPFSLSSSSSC